MNILKCECGKQPTFYNSGAYCFDGIGLKCEECGKRTTVHCIGVGKLKKGAFVSVTEQRAKNDAISEWNKITIQRR